MQRLLVSAQKSHVDQHRHLFVIKRRSSLASIIVYWRPYCLSRMSWFSEIAGKAEKFLDRIDQTTAAALTNSLHEGVTSSVPDSIVSSSSLQPHLVMYQPRYTPTPTVSANAMKGGHSRTSSLGSSFSTVSSRDVTSFGNNGGNNGSSHSHHATPSLFAVSSTQDTLKANSEVHTDDDKLFEYLNAKPSKASKPIPHSKRRPSRETGGRNSDEEYSNASIEVVSLPSDPSGKNSPSSTSGHENEVIDEEKTGVKLDDSQVTVGEDSASVISMDSNATDIVRNPNESRKLKEIIHSLEKEVSSLTKKNIDYETEIKRLNKRIENWQSQLSNTDAVMRDFQAREADWRSTLEARDSAISILKVRLQECDQEVKAKSEVIENLRLEYDMLLKENETKTSSYGQDIVSLQTRLQSLEQELLREKESFQTAHTEAMNQVGILEENNRVLLEEIATTQRDLRAEKTSKKEVDKQMRQLKSSYDSLTREFDEYKTKVVKTLQSKDELIANLTRKSNEGDEGIGDTNDFQEEMGVVDTEKKTIVLQSQCDSLVQEVQDLRTMNDSLKEELKRIQEGQVEDLTCKLSSALQDVEEERRLKNDLEQDLQQSQEECRYNKEDFERIKCSLQERIEERNKEVEKLRKQLIAKRSSSSDNSVQELELRIKSLTQSLIQKQTVIEQLSSERLSLSQQLERSESRLRTALDEVSSHHNSRSGSTASLIPSSPPGSVSIGMVHSASASNLVNRSGYNRASLLDFDDPRDSQVTRRVKRVYSNLDAFSIRTGQFLRVYPTARIILIIYVLLLHVWVFFVLFNYRPEAHDL